MSVPTKYGEDTIERLLDQLAQGKPLKEICAQAGMPGRTTIHRWMQSDDDLAARLLEAREIGFYEYAEQTVELVEDEPDPNRARVILAARQWKLGKLSNAFRDKPVQIGVQVNGSDAGDAFAAVAGALDRAAAAISGGRNSTSPVVIDLPRGSADAAGRLADLAGDGRPGLGQDPDRG